MRVSAKVVLACFGLLGPACTDAEPVAEAPSGHVPEGWAPGVAHRGPRQGPRGFLARRGVIHAHSVYSHDACDGAPRDEESDDIDEPCFDAFRRGLCESRHDFVMLTDHRDSFTRTPYPDALLYRPDRGDELVERGGVATASWLSCGDGAEPALVMAGAEAGTMPVGLEGHVSEEQSERSHIYGSTEPEDIERLRERGAVALVAHTEGWTAEQLVDLPLDGFEMYNVHANLVTNIGAGLALVAEVQSAPERLTHPDLVLLPIVTEHPTYLARWAEVASAGVPRLTTMGTDCHRNTFPQPLPDGERVDSYRRLMIWFSNHVWLAPDAMGGWDDAALKDALRARRLYGVFEMLGYPEGFDFHAEVGDGVVEMGGEARLAEGVRLRVAAPTVRDLDPSVEAPAIALRVLRASGAEWVEQTSLDASEGDALTFEVTEPGGYRAEVRMRPRHLLPYLGAHTELAEQDFVWIYANVIQVVP